MEHPDLHDLLNNPRLSILLLCETHDMTREKLAELAGLSTSQVSRLINATPDLKRSTIIISPTCLAYLEERIKPSNFL